MVVEKSKLGLVHVYTGEGKGKTSAGMGLVVRALGRGLKVKIIQLFKRNTGEQFFFKNLTIEYLQFGLVHPYFKNYEKAEKEDLKKQLRFFLEEAVKNLNEYDVVLIDEFGPGINWDIIDLKFAISIIENKPEKTELILTGRDIPQEIINLADYVSEIKKIKHPYEKGILAREGIEF